MVDRQGGDVFYIVLKGFVAGDEIGFRVDLDDGGRDKSLNAPDRQVPIRKAWLETEITGADGNGLRFPVVSLRPQWL